MKKVALLSIIFLFFLPSTASAHMGGGPPFLKVNTIYAQTNPLFQGAPTEKGLTIPQDLGPRSYLINQPITFEIDTTQLSFDQSLIPQFQFRSTFFTGPNLNQPVGSPAVGTTLQKTFTRPGSYLMTIETKSPGQDFILIDTVLLQILPSENYQLPQSSVIVSTTNKTGTPTTFTNSSKGQSFYWDFDENNYIQGKSVDKTFTQDYFYTPVIARVVDSNGFISDTGVLVIGDKGALSFSPLDPQAQKGSLIIEKRTTNAVLPLLVGGSLVLVIIILGAVLLLRRQKPKIGK